MKRYLRTLSLLLLVPLVLLVSGCSSAPVVPKGYQLTQEQAQQEAWELQWAVTDPANAAAMLTEWGGPWLITRVLAASTTDTDLPAMLKMVFRMGQSAQDPEASYTLAAQFREALDATDPTQRANNTAVISYLLHDAPLSPEFALTLGPALLEKDQSLTAEGKNWSTITASASGSVTTLFNTTDWRVSSDVFTSYLSALALDGSTALTFLTNTPNHTSQTRKPDPVGIARQQYLLQQRDWNTDQYTTITALYQAAATSKTTVGTPQAAGAVSSLIEMLANRSRNSDSKSYPLNLAASQMLQRGTLSNQASTNILHTLKPYLPAIGHYYTPGNDAPTNINSGTSTTLDLPWTTPQPWPVLRRVDIRAVTLAATATPTQQTLLREILNNHRTTIFGAITGTHKNTPNYRDLMNQAALNDAALEALYTTTLIHDHNTITERQHGELIGSSRFYLARTFYNVGAITLDDAKDKIINERGIDMTMDDLPTIFPNGQFPTREYAVMTSGVFDFFTELAEELFDVTSYRTIYEKALNS